MTFDTSAVRTALDPQRVWDRCEALARHSELEGGLTRVFLSPEQRAANALVLDWMRAAGMAAHLDAMGNCVGRYEGTTPGLPCLMLGSHLDTVRDAGKYDGMLGVVSAIECVGALAAAGVRLPFALEVVGFGDEEGVRYGSTLLGSRAVAGTFDRTLLARADAAGITLRDALSAFGLDPDATDSVARRPGAVLAYVELHIEQGPVLEAAGLPVGVVTAINGGNRYAIELQGMAGHAGTVPMTLRRDALAAAAECVLAVERIASGMPDVVGTVGRIEALPGAMNVIPGAAKFSLDVRAPTDAKRHAAVAAIRAEFERIAQRRSVALAVAPLWEARTAPCAPDLQAQIAAAIAAEGVRVHHLPSGAGHDGMALIDVAPIGMLFVRCAGGISHNPAEAVTRADIGTGLAVLARFIAAFVPPSPELTLADPTRTVHDFLAAHRGQAEAFLADLVRVPSDNPPGDCAPHAQRAAELLEAMGFAVERHVVPAERVAANGMQSCTNLVVRVRFGTGTGPVIALNAHGDVVPPGLNWTADPYGAEVRDGFMYGRGVAVSKSDFATYAFALRALQAAAAAGASLDGTVELHFTYDEEAGGAIGPGYLLAEKISAPDLAISAGFTYGITTAHNGCLHLEVEVTGKSGHAAEPEKGVDALEAATGILADLYALRKSYAATRSNIPGIASPTLVIGLIRGGINTNVVPDNVTFRLDRRIIPEENPAEVEATLVAAIEGFARKWPAVKVAVRRILLATPFVPIPGQERLVAALAPYGRAIVGEDLRPHGVPIYTDARLYTSAGVPAVLYGAGPRTLVEANGHRADEKLKLDDLHKATEVVALTLADLLAVA